VAEVLIRASEPCSTSAFRSAAKFRRGKKRKDAGDDDARAARLAETPGPRSCGGGPRAGAGRGGRGEEGRDGWWYGYHAPILLRAHGVTPLREGALSDKRHG